MKKSQHILLTLLGISIISIVHAGRDNPDVQSKLQQLSKTMQSQRVALEEIISSREIFKKPTPTELEPLMKQFTTIHGLVGQLLSTTTSPQAEPQTPADLQKEAYKLQQSATETHKKIMALLSPPVPTLMPKQISS